MKGKRRWLLLPLILLLAFIWGHSLMPSEASAQESGTVLTWLSPLFLRLLPYFPVNDHIIRKLAHFAEYFALGALLCAWFGIDIKKYKQVMPHGFMIAFIDETIQIFTGRGPAISDVWLDLAGVLSGFALLCCIGAFGKKQYS